MSLKETNLDEKYGYEDFGALFVFHAHNMGALNHFPKLRQCLKYPQGGMTY